MSFRPLGARILIKPDRVPDRTRGGLVLPPSVVSEQQRKADRGEVVAMGPGMLRYDGRRWPMPDGIQPGSRVVFDPAGAQVVKIDDQTLLSVRDDFVLAEDLP